jgi:hypothetical protein
MVSAGKLDLGREASNIWLYAWVGRKERTE